MRPEQAVEHARSELERMRAEGAYREREVVEVEPPARPSVDDLLEWAVIEPDLELVTSTRRAGAPIRWLKRALVHLLRQYHGQLESQQTRINVHLLGRVSESEERVADLELRIAELERRLG